VLTQNTAWSNVERALANLRRARAMSARRLAALPPETLASLIRPAGYPRVKARRLQALARWILNRADGRPVRLRSWTTERLREELLAVHGIGPETADSILLYALGRPVFVVDAYTRRFMIRHRWTGCHESYEQVARRFTAALRRDTGLFNEYHALVVALGKRWCRSTPRCGDCPLRRWLPRRPAVRAGPQ